MKTNQCLGCYQSLDNKTDPEDYHKRCCRKLFQTDIPPAVTFGSEQLEEIAKSYLSRHLGITGVQPKVAVEVEKKRVGVSGHSVTAGSNTRLMIVGLWGNFILKPPTPRFPNLSLIEDVTMHMAKAAGISVAEHGLVGLKSGELAYITRRFDRKKQRSKIIKIAVEDFCQLSGLLTERKYKSSMEKAGRIIQRYSTHPGLDLVTFFEIALFSFLTGNADMHLKNFSLMDLGGGEFGLSPAYDLISTALLPINDSEEMALTVNGKKSRLKRADFEAMGETLNIPSKVVVHSFEKFQKAIPQMMGVVRASFLSEELKTKFEKLITSRARVLRLFFE